jgi:hypothetical protein
MKIYNSLLVLIFGVVSCTQPIRRTSEDSQNKKVDTQPEINPDDLPDLKKSIWIYEFATEQKEIQKSLSKIKIASILQEEMLAAFSNAKGPFLAQEAGEEKKLFNMPNQESNSENADVPSGLRGQTEVTISDSTNDMTPEKIAKNLRGSDVSGFMLGKITHLGTSIDGDENEGILRLKTLSLKLSVEYELFDTTTGKVIAKGRENETYSESRSDFLGVAPEMTDLQNKVRKLARSLAEKMAKRMLPFSVKLAWGGRVLKIEGGRIYINAGRKNGLMLGDTLRIVERPRDIVDPQNGEFVGQAPGRVKGTMKLIQFFGTDASVGVLQSGGGIGSGDRVELF